MVLCALLMTLSGALLVYLAHPQQRLLRPSVFPVTARVAGCIWLLAGTLTWCEASGAGAGVASALTAMMCAWVLLPYLAWWRGRQVSAARARQ
ncbi:MAG TPA: hypothetical protein VMA74_00020 [Dyella sp.]|uniref:hypothetical protein n=1 Tax=Dyella sp. TaxID=1869338 RepID=UPI002CC6C353|nr:hypothetical protein [Dyella sp.]HUB88089.1 hypothetical protein [Dyella sp.]